MSRITMVNTDSATLVSSGPTILLSILTSKPEPWPDPNLTIDFHNVGVAGDIVGSNLVFRITFGSQGEHISHQFDAAMFPAGLVVKCSHALELTLETD